VKQLLDNGWAEDSELVEVDQAVKDEIDQATDACVNEPLPPGDTALTDVYLDPPATPRLWYREI
jgi:TPP-dependent pyruvate/acetoin dehydrogenase alpha subunit